MSENKSLFEMYNEKQKTKELNIEKWCHDLYIGCNNKIVCGDVLPYIINLGDSVNDGSQQNLIHSCAIKYGIIFCFMNSSKVFVTEFVAPLPKPHIVKSY